MTTPSEAVGAESLLSCPVDTSHVFSHFVAGGMKRLLCDSRERTKLMLGNLLILLCILWL